MERETPLLALTMGDPAGVGPETIVAAWPELAELGRLVAIGHPEILRRAVVLRNSAAQVVEVTDVEQADSRSDVIPCVRSGSDACLDAAPATVDPRSGQAAYDALVAATQLARQGRVDAICTAPLHKAALARAGHHYPGHTELLAELCGVSDVSMLLYLPPSVSGVGPHGVGVVHVTLHTALRNVFEAITEQRIETCARQLDALLPAISGFPDAPRIGVCALNPHAGEDGLFGAEEQETIGPAVQRLRAGGIRIEGPCPADTLLMRAVRGEFDGVVAMYHDQGHIALKLIGMHQAVNVTLGLPIIRTSVAHGTAFDRAWQGTAESQGLLHAARVALQMVRSRRSTPVALG